MIRLNDRRPIRAIVNRIFRASLDNFPSPCQFERVLEARYERLQEILRALESCVVAYSGGVDSVLLATVAHTVLGDRALAVIADSPSLPRRELADALAIAEAQGFPVRVVRTEEFNNAEYLANPINRCYFCKQELFAELEPLARAEHFAAICYGENASDLGDFRPGAKAASESKVHAPLKEAGLTKDDIRQLSARFGLPTADKPQMACLSSRIPHGERVNADKLRMIEQAECIVRDCGFYDVRVRHHESGQESHARVEVGSEELPRLVAEPMATQIVTAISQLGYARVTLDPLGYRRGSLNPATAAPATP